MATRPLSDPLTVEQLLDGIKRLSAASLCEFRHRFLAWQEENGRSEEDPADLRQAASARLPATEERRLQRLSAKSERGLLTPKELAEYRILAQRSELLSVTRVQALAELARRRDQDAPPLGKETGSREDTGGA